MTCKLVNLYHVGSIVVQNIFKYLVLMPGGGLIWHLREIMLVQVAGMEILVFRRAYHDLFQRVSLVP